MDIDRAIGQESEAVGATAGVGDAYRTASIGRTIDDNGARAAVTGGGLNDDIAGVQGRTQGGTGHVATAAGNGEASRVDQPAAALAVSGPGIDKSVTADHYLSGRRFNRPAVATRSTAPGANTAVNFGATACIGEVGHQAHAPSEASATHRRIGIDAAGMDDAVRGFQNHPAALMDQTAGLQTAAVHHHATHQAIQCLRREDDLTTRCLHCPPVVHQRLDLGRGDHQASEGIVARELQADGLTGRQCHTAHLRHDDALVAHLRREQCNVAARRCSQVTFIDHAAGGTNAVEDIPAGHKVSVGNRVGRSDQTAHVNA